MSRWYIRPAAQPRARCRSSCAGACEPMNGAIGARWRSAERGECACATVETVLAPANQLVDRAGGRPAGRRQPGPAGRDPLHARAPGPRGDRGQLPQFGAASRRGTAVRGDPHPPARADRGWVRDGRAAPRAGRLRACADHLHHRARSGRGGDRGGLRARRGRLRLHADPAGGAAGQGLAVGRGLLAGPAAAVLARVGQRPQRRPARQRGARRGGAPARRRRDHHHRRGRADRLGQPVRA